MVKKAQTKAQPKIQSQSKETSFALKLIAAGFFVAIILGLLLFAKASNSPVDAPAGSDYSVNTTAIQSKDTVSHKGQAGKNALEILKSKADIEQNATGLVVRIDGRKADETKREYWAFSVNGKMAAVGPEEYQTKNEDEIEWKIEKY